MLPSEELLQSIDILAQNAVKNSVKIYTAIVTAVYSNNTCSVRVNGKTHSNIAYYGDAPSINKSYRVFAPNGSMNQAFIITGGGVLPIASANTLGGIKVGAGLSISEQGTLSTTGGGTADAVEWKNVLDKPTTVAGYGITDAKIDGNNVVLGNKTMTPYTPNNPPAYPVTSVNGQTGNVVIPTGGNVDSVNGKTGVVVLDAADVGALPSTTVIPTKTSQLDNDSHYITASEAPVQSVNTKTGSVILTQDDVGDGKTYVRTHNDFTDAIKTQINTNEDNIAMAESDIDGLQTDVGTLKTNVTSLQTALTNKQDVIVGAASTITEDNLAADRALVSNSSGKVAVSNVTSTELGYLDGVTSNVQTQLDKKLETAPVTSVNSKTGAVQLNATDVGALPDSTVIPNKTSQLDNDSGFISELPIASSTQLGGVKVGAGLSVTANGVLSATGGGTADAVEWSNVLDKPTTISGYGITDAKIDNGTITLGDKTITPLTSAPVTSVNSKTGAVVLTANDVGALPADTTIPTVNDATLTIRRNSIDVGSFTANSANDVNIDINVPTDKSDIGLGNVDNVKQYSASNPPPYPVTSVNGQTGDVVLDAGGTQVKIVRW